MLENIEDVFEEFSDTEYLKFDRVTPKFSNRADLHAFILLDKLLPNSKADIISGAAHDEIFLDVDLEELAKEASKDTIRDLVRCGVRMTDYDCLLGMFV